MQKPTPTASKTGQAETIAGGPRKCQSWTESFVAYTDNTESPPLLRKWTAIATIAAVLEQKVWLTTSSRLFPNLFTFLIAPPGIGKSRILNVARDLIVQLPDPYIAPTSVNAATIVDQMKDSKRNMIVEMKTIEYNALCIMVGEFGTFMSKYEDDMVAMLSDFYDVTPYGQRRRGNGGLKIDIERPLLNMLVGSTPANLMKFMPEGAWDQGFTSRIMFICGDQKILVDDFADAEARSNDHLVTDLKVINQLYGEFKVTEEYAKAVRDWRALDEDVPAKPKHPRLVHYNTRRKAHLYRLSMIASVERDSTLILDRAVFNTALGWMVEAEQHMAMLFKTAHERSAEGAIQEIHHFVMDYNLNQKKSMSEGMLVRFAAKKMASYEVLKVLDLMIHSKMLMVAEQDDRTRIRYFVATDGNSSVDVGQALLQ